jgi:hypothetical protein
LAADRSVQEDDVLNEGYQILRKRCHALFLLYGNDAFKDLYERAVSALEQYKGQEAPHTSDHIRHHLTTFAFILSPRMWRKPELLMIMCILVDKDLQYTSINQKDTRDEKCQNRYMACLPVRVQRVIFDRLRSYNCVPDNCVSRDYGGVALCSGGSYKSYYDWFYLPASLFEADISGNEGDVIAEIAGAPASLLVNGPYVRTKDRFNGKPVYAQLNAVELTKFKEVVAEGSSLSARLEATAPSFFKATHK